MWIFRDHVFANAKNDAERLATRDGAGKRTSELCASRSHCFACSMPFAIALTRVGVLHPPNCVCGGRCLCGRLAIFSPDTFGWAAIATLATWLMTLFINRTEHRDTQAIYAKIEILRTQGKARAELTTLDERDVEDIEEHRRRHREPDTRGAHSSWPKK